MNLRGSFLLVPGLVLLLGALRGQSVVPSSPRGIVWHGSYADALKLAKTTGKPLLVQFR